MRRQNDSVPKFLYSIKEAGCSGFFTFALMHIVKLLPFLLLVLAQQAAAQKLTMYKTFGGVVFELNDSVQLSTKQTATVLYQNQQAYEMFNQARVLNSLSGIMGFSGMALVAVPLVTVAFGERSDWGLAGGGAALIVGSIFLNRAFKARALDALDIYNAQLPQKTSRIKPNFYFYGTGARLVIKF